MTEGVRRTKQLMSGGLSVVRLRTVTNHLSSDRQVVTHCTRTTPVQSSRHHTCTTPVHRVHRHGYLPLSKFFRSKTSGKSVIKTSLTRTCSASNVRWRRGTARVIRPLHDAVADCRPCNNRSISPARRAHSSKPANCMFSVLLPFLIYPSRYF